MWLALDIGNSAAKGGLYDGTTLEHVFHVDHHQPAFRADGANAAWTRALQPALDGVAVERVGVASVVPTVAANATAALERLTEAPIESIRPTMRLPFTLAYRTPDTLGVDRLAAAAAAWAAHGADAAPTRPVVAIDAGTAVTLDVITRDGVYEGGVIGPGPALLRRALHDGTAQLPTVPLTWPDRVIGRSTGEGLQSGIMIGFVESVRGLLAQVASTLDDAPVVVATGGWRDLLARRIDTIDRIRPHLVLDGIRVLMELNPPDQPSDRPSPC
jgi:type III pantothenate kinase